jgi:hypothetical protein
VIEGIEDQGGLARAGNAGDNRQALPDLDVYILQVIFARTLNLDGHPTSRKLLLQEYRTIVQQIKAGNKASVKYSTFVAL